MGVKQWKFIPWKIAELEEIEPKTVAIDAPNYMISRMSTFEYGGRSSPDRVPTAHIPVSLGVIRASLNRSILPVFLFDGPPEALKRPTNPDIVQQAGELYKEFVEEGTPYLPQMAQTLRKVPALSWYFSVNHMKELCKAVGVPAITAPSEAEMLAAVLCKEGLAGTVVSADIDSILFGSPHTTKALRITKGEIERATFEDLHKTVGLGLEKLRDLAIICGCDFHPKGVKGIGPRKGVVLLERFGDLEQVLKHRGYNPVERERFLEARAVFDEPDHITPNKSEVKLNAPIVSKLLSVLGAVMGEEKAEGHAKSIVKAWKGFGREQTTLEAWT